MKKIFIVGLFIMGLLVLNFVAAYGYYTLDEHTYNVATDRGVLTISKGVLVDVNADYSTNIATLTEGRTLRTTQGQVYFPAGTYIDCYHEPGYPDPCTASNQS